MNLRAADWVEIRSKDEILGTLDKKGQLDGLPFMPQMFQYCGQQYQVYKRAHKTCDTVNQSGGRWLTNAVHLELRCDGEAYGGCQAACLIFWKSAWLKPANIGDKSSRQSSVDLPSATKQDPTGAHSCSESDVWAGTRIENQKDEDETIYVCQATQLPYYTTLLPWWDVRQYIEDYTSRNVTLGRMLRGFLYVGLHVVACRRRVGRPFRWIYDNIQSLWGGIPFPRRSGTIPVGQHTPTSTLNLQPGELVRVKTYAEVLATLTVDNKNRGLAFDAELVPYCGGVYRVRTRVSKFINEKTGKIVKLNNDAIILDGVWCQARYSDCRMFCPRSIYSWWREVWLERVSD
jgi:hypothetical protein